MLNITTISDTHGKHANLKLSSGDLIIHAGDCTPRGEKSDIEEFLKWYGDLDFDKKVLIAGNHDFGFERSPQIYKDMCDHYKIDLLNDSGIKYKGLNIWGSPVQPEFFNWAFNRSRTIEAATTKHPYIGNHWDLIPNNTDILVTHGPPMGVLDFTFYDQTSVGCKELMHKVNQIKPVLHVFGHIHEARGVVFNPKNNTTYNNAASLDLQYKPYQDKPFKFEWDKLILGLSKGQD